MLERWGLNKNHDTNGWNERMGGGGGGGGGSLFIYSCYTSIQSVSKHRIHNILDLMQE